MMPANFQGRRKKWKAFMDRQSDCKTMVLINFNTLPERPWPYPDRVIDRLDWAVKSYYAQMEAMEWLDDDTLPYLSPYTGTEIFAEALGCKVHYSGGDMPFALPMIHKPSEIAKLKPPKIEDSTLYALFELARGLLQRAGTDAVLQIPDIQSPVDIAALVWEKEQFLMAMLDDPEAVNEIIAITERLLTDFLDAWFKEFGAKYIAHFPDYYMEGGFTFSEDEAGEFSPDLFKQFCLPAINRLSDRYGGCAMHCCANSRHQWGRFKEIKGLRLLNLIQPDDVLADAAKFFGTDVCQWHGLLKQGQENGALPEWAKTCPHETHIVLQAQAGSKEEAKELCARLRELGNSR